MPLYKKMTRPPDQEQPRQTPWLFFCPRLFFLTPGSGPGLTGRKQPADLPGDAIPGIGFDDPPRQRLQGRAHGL